MTVIFSPISGRLVGRSGPRIPLAIAGVFSFAACAMLVDIGPSTALAWLHRRLRRLRNRVRLRNALDHQRGRLRDAP